MRVDSTNLGDVKHLRENSIVRVLFLNGDTWEYDGVPEVVFNALTVANSPGQFFISDIRKNYPGRKVSTICGSCGKPIDRSAVGKKTACPMFLMGVSLCTRHESCPIPEGGTEFHKL